MKLHIIFLLSWNQLQSFLSFFIVGNTSGRLNAPSIFIRLLWKKKGFTSNERSCSTSNIKQWKNLIFSRLLFRRKSNHRLDSQLNSEGLLIYETSIHWQKFKLNFDNWDLRQKMNIWSGEFRGTFTSLNCYCAFRGPSTAW